jgi:hypothetical protein
MIIGTALLLGCIYVYVSSISKDSVLVESFEGKIGADTVDYGSSENSSMIVKASTKASKCGRQSVELKYDLKPYGYVYFAKGYGLHHRKDTNSWGGGRSGWIVPPEKISWKDYEAFSIALKGKGVGKVAIDLKDSGGELWRYTLHVDTPQWKKFTIPFDDLAVRRDWQPESAVLNKYIDYPFNSFQIEPKKLGSGTLYADCVQFVEL